MPSALPWRHPRWLEPQNHGVSKYIITCICGLTTKPFAPTQNTFGASPLTLERARDVAAAAAVYSRKLGNLNLHPSCTSPEKHRKKTWAKSPCHRLYDYRTINWAGVLHVTTTLHQHLHFPHLS